MWYLISRFRLCFPECCKKSEGDCGHKIRRQIVVKILICIDNVYNLLSWLWFCSFYSVERNSCTQGWNSVRLLSHYTRKYRKTRCKPFPWLSFSWISYSSRSNVCDLIVKVEGRFGATATYRWSLWKGHCGSDSNYNKGNQRKRNQHKTSQGTGRVRHLYHKCKCEIAHLIFGHSYRAESVRYLNKTGISSGTKRQFHSVMDCER